MNTDTPKLQDQKNVSKAKTDSNKHSGKESVFQFVDKRSGTIAQRKLQEMADNYAESSSTEQLQSIVYNNETQKHSSKKQETIQLYKKEGYVPNLEGLEVPKSKFDKTPFEGYKFKRPNWYKETFEELLKKAETKEGPDPFYEGKKILFVKCQVTKQTCTADALDIGHIVDWGTYVKDKEPETVREAINAYNDLNNLRLESSSANRSGDFEKDLDGHYKDLPSKGRDGSRQREIYDEYMSMIASGINLDEYDKDDSFVASETSFDFDSSVDESSVTKFDKKSLSPVDDSKDSSSSSEEDIKFEKKSSSIIDDSEHLSSSSEEDIEIIDFPRKNVKEKNNGTLYINLRTNESKKLIVEGKVKIKAKQYLIKKKTRNKSWVKLILEEI